MKNKKIYAFAVLILAIVLTLAFTAVTISAAEVTMDLSKAKVSEEYTLKDAEGNVFTAYYGLKADDNSMGRTIYIAFALSTEFLCRINQITAVPEKPVTETNMNSFRKTKRRCYLLRWHTVTPTARILRQARMQTPATAQLSSLSGRSRSASEALPRS